MVRWLEGKWLEGNWLEGNWLEGNWLEVHPKRDRRTHIELG